MTPELHQDCDAAKELGKVAFISKIPFDAARDQDFVVMLNNTIKKHKLSVWETFPVIDSWRMGWKEACQSQKGESK